MSQELNNVAPSRQMSGRRSKPSMELLIDNQRVLSQYIIPRKNTKLSISKKNLDTISVSNQSDHSSVSFKKKIVSKSQKRKIIIKSREENISPKSINRKRKIVPLIVNGSDDVSEIIKPTSDNNLVISRTPYSTLKIKKINNENIKLDNGDNDTDKDDDDDLPLSKVFPDFKPKVVEPIEPIPSPEKRAILALPPKKKIKFVNINELNGFQMFPKSTDNNHNIPIKSDISSLPKIPKKSKTPINSISSTAELPLPSNEQSNEISNPSDDKIDIVEQKTEENAAEESPANDGFVLELETSGPPSPPPAAAVVTETPRRCVRDQCTNVAIEDSRWHREFCSADCAVMHTKNVFVDWVQQRRELMMV